MNQMHKTSNLALRIKNKDTNHATEYNPHRQARKACLKRKYGGIEK